MTRLSSREETRSSQAALVATYRQLLTLIGIGTVLGAFAELASLRHWGSPAQLIPWVLLTILLIAALAWSLTRTTVTVRILRGAAIVAVLGSAFGVFEHIQANLESGPLDARYSATWATMSTPAQLWTAASGGVGPSPLLAPGMIGLAGVLLWLATLGWTGNSPD